MSRSMTLLKKRYLTNMKENPKIYVGIELEFPIVEKDGRATDNEVAKSLLKELPHHLDFTVEKYDSDGNPIQLFSKKSEDRILFEVSYTTLEFAFGKAERINEVEERFEEYLTVIQSILSLNNHEIQGWGIHPNWQKNTNVPVKSPRYEMLMEYLSLSKQCNRKDLHSYPEYGAFICGSQIQLDVSHDNYITVINTFNQIEAAKAYLFANSEFWGQDWSTKISRDIFWEKSMHGIYHENVGVNPTDFQTERDFFNYLDQTALFTAEREGQILYFEPIRSRDYLQIPFIKAYTLDGKQTMIVPQEEDFTTHRSYQYQDLTTRGTVEFRSVCTQSLDKTFAPAAFHLGLLANLSKVVAYLKQADFFKENGRDYKKLRRQYSQKILSDAETKSIQEFSDALIKLAKEGLVIRSFSEEKYLASF